VKPTSSRVKSAERALDVIELLAGALRPVPSMAIARRCAMPKSSTHHLLNVLRDRGWAVYDAEHRGWTLGPEPRRLVEACREPSRP
jgi:DNA-binding IclR family transcriptional regulator